MGCLVLVWAGCSSGGTEDVDAGPAAPADARPAAQPDASVDAAMTSLDAAPIADAAPDADAEVLDAEAPDAVVVPDLCDPNPCFERGACTPTAGGFTCAPCPAGREGDGVTCADIDGCAAAPCAAGVACTDVPAPSTGFTCGACPAGLEGDGVTCTEIDGCAGAPCLPGSTCTDVPAPADAFTCTPCVGPGCPIFRALAGPDQQILAASTTTLAGSAVGYNGAFRCSWTDDRTTDTWATCTPTVAPVLDTTYTLTVTDAAGATATDSVVVRLAALVADAGPDTNIETTETATLTARWSGASCPGGGCVSCEWRLSTGALVASTCTTVVSPTATTQYFLTVTDAAAGRTARDDSSVFVVDQPAQLCGWNVVVMTSDEYPSAPNPNYVCDANGTARRQTVNGKPAIVLSDLQVQNVRITGHISVETGADDDLIGFLWGWQNPAHAYLLTWKQLDQNWTAACGNAPAGIAIKKIDGAAGAPTTVSFNPAFGFNGTDYRYNCAIGWSQDRANAALLGDASIFLMAPGDPGAHRAGWADATTYRFEFYYTPTRTRVLVYRDELRNGSTAEPITSLLVEDSSYPAGAFAFFSNSQEQVEFGNFVLASLSDYRADAGPDQVVAAGASTTVAATVTLAVPPYTCEWSDGSMTLVASGCAATVSPSMDTTYSLTVTDDFGRVATDEVVVRVAP